MAVANITSSALIYQIGEKTVTYVAIQTGADLLLIVTARMCVLAIRIYIVPKYFLFPTLK